MSEDDTKWAGWIIAGFLVVGLGGMWYALSDTQAKLAAAEDTIAECQSALDDAKETIDEFDEALEKAHDIIQFPQPGDIGSALGRPVNAVPDC